MSYHPHRRRHEFFATALSESSGSLLANQQMILIGGLRCFRHTERTCADEI